MREPDSDAASEGSAGVRVLARGLAVLQAFEPDNPWRSNAELATKTNLPKPTVSRLTANLTQAGYLIYSAPKAQYRLGASVLALGFMAASNRDIRMLARPLMQQLADRHNASVVLASSDGLSMVCHEVCHSQQMLFALRVRAGSRLKLGQSALGRAFIGALGQRKRSELLAALANTHPTDWPALRAEIDAAGIQMQAHGYCTTSGTLETGTNGIATVIDLPGRPHAYAVGCAVPAHIFPIERLEREVALHLLELKRHLENDLSTITPPAPSHHAP